MNRARLALVVTALALTSVACSTSQLDTTSPVAQVAGSEQRDGVAVFDSSVVHEIAIDVDVAAYDAMLAAYQETGEKEWVEATVTIDGETFERAGLRLKGNSSLRGISSSTTDSPEDLPYLIRLNEFVEGQTYQGYEDFVVRSNNSETALNEAVALALLDEAGLASQEAVATRFSVNGSDAVLRLVVEHPDDDQWYESWFDDAEGALYKAESTGDWSYRGDDPEAYEEVFDQEGGSEVADLTPLIEFLEFVNDSDDETFSAELSERLDVEAFATYLAMMDLIGNTDDIDGPGNNSYLWWDASTEQFTVVPWDMNLSLGTAMGGPGGGGFPGGDRGGPAMDGDFPEGMEPPADGAFPEGMEPPADGAFPEGVEPPTDGAFPDGLEPPTDGEFAGPGRGGPAGGQGGGFGGGSNPLVERFLADEEFSALYDQRLEELSDELVDSGDAETVLAEWVEVLTTQATDLVDADVVEAEASTISSFLGT